MSSDNKCSVILWYNKAGIMLKLVSQPSTPHPLFLWGYNWGDNDDSEQNIKKILTRDAIIKWHQSKPGEIWIFLTPLSYIVVYGAEINTCGRGGGSLPVENSSE